MKIGTTLQNLRKKQGFKQGVFAKMVGISSTSLSQIERDITVPKKSTLDKICSELKISEQILYLLSVKKEDVPEKNKELYDLMFPQVKELMFKIFSEPDEKSMSLD